ncbi:MAG: hypothetical protein ACE5FH_10190, partial [Candidatus Zixiibacteriota bacterium]
SPSSTSGQPGDAALPSRLPRREGYELYVALRFDGMPSDFMGAALFLDGPVTLLKQVRWAQWYSGDAGGNFGPGTCFCPGLTSHIAEMIEPTQRGVLDWGGLRSSSDLFDFLEPNFVRLPNSFTSSWRPGPPGSILRSLASNSAIDLPPDADQLYWMRLDLPEGGDKEPLRQSLSISFDCFIAFNKEAHSVHKYTAGNRLMEIEIPDHVDSVLEIESVVDSNGRDYLPHHDIRSGQFPSYTIERQGDTLVFWFEFSAVDKLPPDSITVHYSTTEGINANGIDLGRIDQLHENHPGIASVTNVLPSAGAVPAKTEEQIVAEISSRLRNRDRALGFAEIEAWAQSFDPRIQSAECRKSVERAERGVRRCTAVRLIVSAEAFHSNDETDLLARRMRNFLKSRSPINSHFTVEVNRI